MRAEVPAVNVKPSHSLVVLAWAAVLITTVPVIAWNELSRQDQPLWFRLAIVGALAFLLALSQARSAWRSMRGFLLAMLALGIGIQLVGIVFESGYWKKWQSEGPWPLVQLTEVSVPLVMVFFVALAMGLTGLRRRDAFLVKGRPDAPILPKPKLPGFPPGLPWKKALFSWSGFLPVFLGAVILISLLEIGFDLGNIGQALIWLPAVIVAAAVNAFREEFVFRTVLLSHLQTTLGSSHAVWLTAAAFGLGHFYGTPSGIPGVFLAGFLGLIFAKSILETGGLYLAVLVHFLADAVLYFFEAMTVD